MKKFVKTCIKVNFLILSACLVVFTTSIATAQQQNTLAHQHVTHAAESFVFNQLSFGSEDSLNVQAQALDSRLQIPHCPTPLSMTASEEALRQSNITVRASCDATNWYLYLIVKATRMQDVVVLTRAVGPNTVLTQSNVEVVQMDKNMIRTSTFGDIDTVLGARLKKRSRPGQPIVPGQLCFVCKGDNVLITANASGLEIKTTGIAQQDGNLGDTIRVKNSHSKKLVHGQVIDTKKVMVQI